MNSVKLYDTKPIYKNLAFLNTKDKLSEREINKSPIYNSIRKNKMPKCKLNQGLYTENYDIDERN